MNQSPILMLGMPGTLEMVVIVVIALLIFGRRLPDVARSVGKSIVEFKRGIRDVKDDISIESKIDPNAQIESKSGSADQVGTKNQSDS